jgi:molybdenum cofactor biosynthesis enzyme MoaA
MRTRDARSVAWDRWKSNRNISCAAKNFVKYVENVWDQTADVDNFPWLAYIEPTRNCNLRCPACKPDFRQPRYENLTFDEFRRLVDEIGKYLYFIELFRAGDSFAHKDIFRMLQYLRDNSGAIVQISTNGSFRWSHAQMIQIANTVDYLDICIDGLTPATHTRYRVRSNFDLIFSNMMRLKTIIDRQDAPCCLGWRFIIFKHNEHEVPQARRIAEDLGIPIQFIGAEVTGPGVDETWLPRDESLWREEYRNPVEDVLGMERLSGPRRARLSEDLGREGLIDLDDARLFSGRMQKAVSQWYPTADSAVDVASLLETFPRIAPNALGQCPWLTGGTVVTSDGILNPCCNLAADMGGLIPGLFQKTYRSPLYTEARAKGMCDGCNPNWIREWQVTFSQHAKLVCEFLHQHIDLLDHESKAMVGDHDLAQKAQLGHLSRTLYPNQLKCSSVYGNHDAYGALFDRDDAYWHAESGLPQWLQLQFDNVRLVRRVRLQTPVYGNAMLRQFRLLGCSDRGEWQELLAAEHPDSPDLFSYNLSEIARFKQYRIEIQSTWRSDGYAAVQRLWLDAP